MKMIPGRMSGTEIDREGPLEHRVMKQFTENPVTHSAFQMSPVGVMSFILVTHT